MTVGVGVAVGVVVTLCFHLAVQVGKMIVGFGIRVGRGCLKVKNADVSCVLILSRKITNNIKIMFFNFNYFKYITINT